MRILVTGGAGFIGINTVMSFANAGEEITVLDSLNKTSLIRHFINLVKGFNIEFIKGDIREWNDIVATFNKEYDVVIHLASQTAVTHSVTDPVNDFHHNAVGTFHVLEGTRQFSPKAKFIYACTNKVYGNLSQYTPIKGKMQYSLPVEHIDESEPLDFHSPYGCSKGAGDQYVRDYHRIYNMDTHVVRQSCIYGPFQDGTEDQGWVAWFIKAFLAKKSITIYGDGKQVRDILHVKDLVNFYKILINNGPPGQVYNLGGGKDNVISLLNLIEILEEKLGPTNVDFAEERPGDQKVFISNNAKAMSIGWKPTIPVERGLDELIVHLTK